MSLDVARCRWMSLPVAVASAADGDFQRHGCNSPENSATLGRQTATSQNSNIAKQRLSAIAHPETATWRCMTWAPGNAQRHKQRHRNSRAAPDSDILANTAESSAIRQRSSGRSNLSRGKQFDQHQVFVTTDCINIELILMVFVFR